jgi:DNA adenine methylase
MQYLGGKHKLAKWLAAHILPRKQGRLFEPFHGGLSATVALQPYVASDSFEPLTRLIAAVRAGWEPPEIVTEETYFKVRGSGTPLEAFVGFCCSYSGKWYAGYAKDNAKNPSYARQGKNALLRKINATRSVHFQHRDYFWVDPQPGDTLYCDPPYMGTTTYGGLPAFDHKLFWNWCEWQAKRGVLVFVSEFTGPSQYVLAKIESKTAIRTKLRDHITNEKLFMLAPK